MTDMGNDAGDDFGKFAQEDRESTNLFLGDESGKQGSTGYGNWFSPGKQRLREGLFLWSTKGVSGDTDGKYRGFCCGKKGIIMMNFKWKRKEINRKFYVMVVR